MKMLQVLITIFILLFLVPIKGNAQPKECPVQSDLEIATIKDKKEVIKSLGELIPKTYGIGIEDYTDMYTKWNVVTANPFPKTVGNEHEEDYYGMAKKFCGKDIAEKSWLVRLNFPEAPGTNLAQGQMFLAKSKEKGCH